MRSKTAVFAAIFAVLLALPLASAVTITGTIGSYDSNVYKNSQVLVPVSVQVQNGTGTATITINPMSGLSCTTCSNLLTYSSSGTQSTSFTLTADNTGTYSSPFTVTSAISGATTDSKTASNTIIVNEIPSWTLTLTGSKSSVSAGDSVDLTFTITTTNTLQGVTATLSLPSGWSRTSGSATYNLGTVTGTSQATWTVSASSPSSSNTITVNVASTNPAKSDSKTLSISKTSSSGTTTPGAGTSSSSSSGTSGKEEKKVVHKPTPPGLLNNTKLQAAIEKVLAKGKLNQNAIDNLVRLSNEISGQSDISRSITVENATSKVKTSVKYKGAKVAKNYVVYEKVPKAFANSSDNITVSVTGAKVEVVEQDPEYAIVFDTVSPNQELNITYTVRKAVSTAVVDSFSSEVYAESLVEAAPVCAQVITPAKNTATGECREFPTPCDVPAGWAKVNSCPAAAAGNETTTPPVQPSGEKARTAYYLIAIIAIFALAYYYLVMRGKGPEVIRLKRRRRMPQRAAQA